ADLAVQELRDGAARLGIVLVFAPLCVLRHELLDRMMLVAEFGQAARHILDRQGEIDEAGRNGGFRHAALTRRAAIAAFGHCETATLLDGLDAERPVAAASREDHADGALATLLGERA